MPIHFVAELGTTWLGDLDFAKELVLEFKRAGADACKFQLFREEHLDRLPVEVQDKLKPMIFTEESFTELVKFGVENRIDVFASAMYLEAIDILVCAGCKFVKIREKDSGNEEFIEKALETGKFVLISTTKLPLEAEILFHPKIRWMYVVPFYPPREREIHLSQVAAYKGFSDHYPGISSAVAASAIILDHYGGTVDFIIEKHVVPEHDPKYVDDPVSITLDEFRDLVKYVRQLEQMGWEATDKKFQVI